MLLRQLSKVLLISIIFFTSCGPEIPKEIEMAYQDLPDIVDFNYDVKPILSDKCFACHGPDAVNQKANLRLDTQEGAYKALHGKQNKYAIVPGKPTKSHVIHRILSDDAEFKMPPPDSHLSLNKNEIATLIKWVEQGATYKTHWAFIPPAQAALPAIKDTSWPGNEIDYFVLNKLSQKKLLPSERAKKETLIRRLSFDLTGLPPTIEDIESFIHDNTSNAYEKLVDRLLASPAYGERMAMEWLDVARYADSDGYLDDKHRDFTPWKDWVIASFNQNMPYDQFVTYQLAGDLLPDPTKESILATAFNRLHRKNSEAGIVFEEYRVEYVADRTQTLGKAFMGLTVECARCHDHKYDPLTQENFYQLFSFFNSTKELGTPVYGPDQVPGPSLYLSTEEQNKIIDLLEDNIDIQEKELKAVPQSYEKEFNSWISQKETIEKTLDIEQNQALISHYTFDSFAPKAKKAYHFNDKTGQSKPAVFNEPVLKEGAMGNGLFISDFTKGKFPDKMGWFGNNDPFTISFYLYPDTLYEDVVIFTHCEDLRLGLKGYSLFLENNSLKFIMAYSWPNNALQVKTPPLPQKQWSHVTITYDGSGKAGGIKIYLDGHVVQLKIDHDNLYKSILFKPDVHTYGFSGLSFGQRGHMKTFKKGGLDEFKLFNRALSQLESINLYNSSQAKKVIAQAKEPSNLEILKQHFFQIKHVTFRNKAKLLKQKRSELVAHLDSIPEIMVMGDLRQPRPTFILDRGVYDARGKEVSPNTPSAILPFDPSLPKNRLGLAKWLFDPNHPLTSRVFVNRIWQQFFGQGLVKTADDFGNQGKLPSHPNLLDWLAVYFVASDWDIKALQKLIVMSATYQQRSVINQNHLEKDPTNVYLARGPRFRLSAEMIRDNALAISGLLVKKIGGKSVYPYQPAGLWDEISNKPWRYKYLQKPGNGLYRRSLYSIWKRSSPPPSMMIFDAPDRSVCTVSRSNTSTPLQALVLLNDPQYIEVARVIAENIMIDDSNDSLRQLEKAFVLITGRQPDKKEMDLLEDFYQQEFERFSTREDDALRYLDIGEKPRNLSLNPIKTASLATVVNGIMNTSEGYTRK